MTTAAALMTLTTNDMLCEFEKALIERLEWADAHGERGFIVHMVMRSNLGKLWADVIRVDDPRYILGVDWDKDRRGYPLRGTARASRRRALAHRWVMIYGPAVLDAVWWQRDLPYGASSSSVIR